jgi:hypothetical protein
MSASRSVDHVSDRARADQSKYLSSLFRLSPAPVAGVGFFFGGDENCGRLGDDAQGATAVAIDLGANDLGSGPATVPLLARALFW